MALRLMLCACHRESIRLSTLLEMCRKNSSAFQPREACRGRTRHRNGRLPKSRRRVRTARRCAIRRHSDPSARSERPCRSAAPHATRLHPFEDQRIFEPLHNSAAFSEAVDATAGPADRLSRLRVRVPDPATGFWVCGPAGVRCLCPERRSDKREHEAWNYPGARRFPSLFHSCFFRSSRRSPASQFLSSCPGGNAGLGNGGSTTLARSSPSTAMNLSRTIPLASMSHVSGTPSGSPKPLTASSFSMAAR